MYKIFFFVFLLINVYGYSCNYDKLFCGINVGDQWGDIKTQVKVIENKPNGSIFHYKYNAHTYASSIVLSVDAMLHNGIKVIIVLNQEHGNIIRNESEILMIYTLDKSFKIDGRHVIGKSIYEFKKYLLTSKVLFDNPFCEGVVVDNCLWILTKPLRDGLKKIWKSDTINLVGLVRKEDTYGGIPLKDCYIDENYEDWKKKQKK